MTASLYEQPLVYRMLFDAHSADVPFYAELARACGGTTLECGVGIGRIAIALAREGYRVHGVDVDASMLAHLRQRLEGEARDVAERVSFERADVKTMRLDRTFPLIVAPFNGMAHQHRREDLVAYLESVRAHLAPGGLFAFDLWIPDPQVLLGGVADSPRFFDPRTGAPTRCTERKRYDAITQVLTVEMELTSIDREDAPERLSLSLRQLFPEETAMLLDACGFEVVHRTSRFTPIGGPGVDREGEDERGELLAWVCRAR